MMVMARMAACCARCHAAAAAGGSRWRVAD